MKSTRILSALTLIAATTLAGCASNSPQQTSNAYPASNPAYSQSSSSRYGAIESIQAVRTANTSTTGVGAVAGGVVGGLLGNQVGGGSGKAIATVAGVVGGALIGNTVEKSRTAQPETVEIRVRLDNGDIATVTQDSVHDMAIGNRVRIADGRAYRY